MNRDDRRRRIEALTATLITVGLILLALLTARLRYNGDEPRVWPPVDSAELLLAGEYVMAGDIPQPELNDPRPAPEAAEQPAPEADDLTDTGTPGTNLKGRTLSSWEKPAGTQTGTITITVRVNRQGHVIAASYATGTGPVASQPAARRSCEQAAMRSRFSVDLDAAVEQTGTITYRFE